ncbi:hypothetical protein UO65_5368 [Actinokineospora spheciospongiae]|uniref:Uncharacterized protein n=1 Tax=Actinokineospora spheciospongiae TaxID=909613 RepID=W7IGB7_9PSEU|nr:hypothetical protein UO65_5368 [Actinokineospora spheciospongiae]
MRSLIRAAPSPVCRSQVYRVPRSLTANTRGEQHRAQGG